MGRKKRIAVVPFSGFVSAVANRDVKAGDGVAVKKCGTLISAKRRGRAILIPGAAWYEDIKKGEIGRILITPSTVLLGRTRPLFTSIGVALTKGDQ